MLRRLSRMPLQAKLAFSYLGVALGAILMVAIITLALQNYFYSSQRDQLRSQAEYLSQQIGISLHSVNDNWANLPPIPYYSPEILGIMATNQQIYLAQHQGIPSPSDSEFLTLKNALIQSLQGQERSGNLQDTQPDVDSDADTFSGIFVTVPIYDNGQASGTPVGALFLAQPDKYPTGFSPSDVLATVNKVLAFAAIIITGLVILLGIFIARSLTRPLVSLTEAAEQMKAGNYAQRATTPRSQDEIGTLALTFNDMADKIEADVNELRLQDQLRRDLIANIAHDLVTPLTAIQGYSEAIADEVIHDPQSRQETAQLIGREVQRLRRLVSDMQNMTVLESGQMSLELAPLNMHSLVDEVLSVIGPECEQAHIRLRNEIAPSAPLVLADSDRITQALLNLLDNARRHTPVGGSISVSAQAIAGEQGKKWLDVVVSDTGSGIHPTDLPFIFDRFFRGDRARSGQHSGSGLGLSIVKTIIVAHGGSVRAESTPGEGTRIGFTLPVAQ